MHIGPEIGHQLLHTGERIGSFGTLEVPVIAFAALVVIANLPAARMPIEQRLLRSWAEGGTGDSTRQSTISTIAPSA